MTSQNKTTMVTDMEEITKRGDAKTLKKFNLLAYQNDDDITKDQLIAISQSPIVVLDTPDRGTINKLHYDGMMEKIRSAGVDCLYKPFYSKCVYTTTDSKNVYFYVEVIDDFVIRGVVYSDIYKNMGYMLPVAINRTDLGSILTSDELILGKNVVDLESVSKSPAVRANLKRLYGEFSAGSFSMTEKTIEVYETIREDVMKGTHEMSADQIKLSGLSVNEYALTGVFSHTSLIKTVLDLGLMHVSDYYPFTVQSGNKKEEKN